MRSFNHAAEKIMNLYCCMYDSCDSQYTTKYNLKRHVESVHMHKKRYFCRVCEGFFSSKQSLTEHLHIHSGVMPFKCSVCGKFFRQASQISLHRRLHVLQGVDAQCSRMKIDEKLGDISPIEIDLSINEADYVLPKISNERMGIVSLPFPDIKRE